MRSSSLALATVAVSLASVAPAHADLLKIYGEVVGGAMLGTGTGGDLVHNDTQMFDEAYYQNAGPLAYGLTLGARVLIFDAHISHRQYKAFNDDLQKPDLATWTDFALGLGFEIGLGQETQAQKRDGTGTFLELGANVAFGLGTGAQIDPPLSNDEITDKGFTLKGRIGIGTHLNKVFDLGVAAVGGYGYYFKNEAGAVVNDLSNHYQSAQIEGLVYLRANIRLL